MLGGGRKKVSNDNKSTQNGLFLQIFILFTRKKSEKILLYQNFVVPLQQVLRKVK